MRFGLDTGPDEFGARETSLIVNALRVQKQYYNGLAARNREPEALGRNLVHALEIQVLMEKIKDVAR